MIAGSPDASGSALGGRARGVALVSAGVLLLSPDSVFVRLLTVDDATVIFLRGASALVGYVALLRWRSGGPAWSALRRIGRAGAGIACLAVIGNTCFVVSVRHTAAAHALLILAAAPTFTALLAWGILRERVPARTWIALAVVAGGVTGLFLARPDPGQLMGDAVALAGALSLATLLVLTRRSRGIDMVACLALGAALTALVWAPFAHPASMTAGDAAIIASFGAVMLPLSLALITRGPAYLPAPDVSLLLLIETVLGPLWVWLVVDEQPSLQALLSGVVILAALAGHAIASRAGLSERRAGAP